LEVLCVFAFCVVMLLHNSEQGKRKLTRRTLDDEGVMPEAMTYVRCGQASSRFSCNSEKLPLDFDPRARFIVVLAKGETVSQSCVCQQVCVK
jgi:hypothetical protein